MRTYQIALIPGDTVGPELIRQATKVLNQLTAANTVSFNLHYLTACGPAIEQYNTPLPDHELELAMSCDAVLFGNIGSSCYQKLPLTKRPEYALLEMRKHFSVTTNLRPVFIRQGMEELSPLKPGYLKNGFDILVVRDIQGGMFAGKGKNGFGEQGQMASDLEFYNEEIIEQTARWAYEAAQMRRQKVTSLDKANVLTSSTLWRKKVTEMAASYPTIQLEHQYVDSAAMNVIKEPGEFDVILTNNVFGDIIADELTQLAGTPSLFGSAELSQIGKGIYTPNQLHHPDENLTSRNIISPIGIFSAVSMMLCYSCREIKLAQQVSRAIDTLFDMRLTTPELPITDFTQISTEEMGDEMVRLLTQF